MKTRIISAAVMISVVIAALLAGKLIPGGGVIITVFIAVICGIAIFELLNNALKIEALPVCLAATVYGVFMIFLLDKNMFAASENGNIAAFFEKVPTVLTVIYFLAAVAIIILKQKDFDLPKIFGFTAFPFLIAYAFSTINGIISFDKGIYYLLLLVNFSSICDTGAYFTGSFFGKHKLCPEVSPKKTVEGAIGGIVSSLVVSLILAFFFGDRGHLLVTLAATILLCVAGMFGDLFASIIKRRAGIKDYGNLIPGHGGILDRFDSMLLIAPLFYMFMELGAI